MADSAMTDKNDVEEAVAVTDLDKTNDNRPVVLNVEHVAKATTLALWAVTVPVNPLC